MGGWGIEGALHQVFGLSVEVAWYHDAKAKELMSKTPMALIGYYEDSRTVRGRLRLKDQLESHLLLSDEPPLSQFGEGWYDDNNPLWWIAPKAEITLRRPADSHEFELVPYLPAESVAKDGPARITVLEDGRPLGTQQFARPSEKPAPLLWKLPGDATGDHLITIVSEPVRHLPGNSRNLGIAVSALGYVSP